MTRTNLSIQLVLILATAIGIHGQTPREATLTLKNDFEDGQSNREFKVDYPGVANSNSAIIRIFQVGDNEAKVNYEILTNAQQPKLFHFELHKDEAPAGSLYTVQVCLSDGQTCSEKRPAVGHVLKDSEKPLLSCRRVGDKEETEFDKLVDVPNVEVVNIQMKADKKFVGQEHFGVMPAGSQLNIKSNPQYEKVGTSHLFYAAVWYDGKPLKDLFKKISGFCSRKYIFWAAAHVVHKDTKEVKLRYRGTHIITEELARQFILNDEAKDFPVEFARYDTQELPVGEYYVSVSFCASEKDVINSSICTDAVYSDFKVEESK